MHVPGEIQAMVGENAKLSEHGSTLAGYGNQLEIARVSFDFRSGVAHARDVTHLLVNYYNVYRFRDNLAIEDEYTIPVGILTVKRAPTILYRLKNLPAHYRMSEYEKGVQLLQDGQPALALEKFREEQGKTIEGLLQTIEDNKNQTDIIIQEKNRIIDELNEQIQTLSAETGEVQAQSIEELNETIKNKDQEIEQLYSQLYEHTNNIEEQKSLLSEKDQKIQELTTQLEQSMSAQSEYPIQLQHNVNMHLCL